MSNILCLEACTEVVSAAIYGNGTLLAESLVEKPQQPSSVILMSLVEDIINAPKWRREDINVILCSKGPGSFTSVRVCVATALGLSKGLSVPLYGINALEALAQVAAHDDLMDKVVRPVLALIDARRGELYSAMYMPESKGRMKTIIAPSIVGLDEIISSAKRAADGEILAVGSGAALYKAELAARGFSLVRYSTLNLPHASALGRIFINATEEEREAMTWAPAYLRKSEAERNAEAKERA